MKHLIGFILFWIAAGMLFMILLPNTFIGILFIGAFLLIGYNLYCGK